MDLFAHHHYSVKIVVGFSGNPPGRGMMNFFEPVTSKGTSRGITIISGSTVK